VIFSRVMASRRLGLGLGRTLGGVALTFAVLLGTPALAQTDDQRAGARAAATAGAQAFMERRWAESVDMFTRAESLVHSPVHLLYMARSYEKLGALVKAREAYIKVANEDIPAGAPQPVREAKADAERELEALEPRVPYVSVVVQGAGPRPVTVTMDGVPVPPALLGVPRPVDPGEHRFEAVAEGMEGARSTISVREKRSETVVLTLNPAVAGAAPVAAAPAPQPASAAPAGAPAPAQQPAGPWQPGAPAQDTASSGGGGISPLAWVALGVGAVGLGVGTVFGLQSNSKVKEANDLCSKSDCSGTNRGKAEDLDDEARSARTIGIVGFVAGGIGVATGVTLILIGSKKQETATRTIEPWVGLGSAGVSGRF